MKKVNSEIEKKRNYDAKKVIALLKKAKKMKIFEEIKDPVKWQRELRKEWE